MDSGDTEDSSSSFDVGEVLMAASAAGLDDLRAQISLGAIGNSRDGGGAGVVVGPPSLPETSDDGFYPDPVYVATKYHRELSWLFGELRTVFALRIDFINKFDFFGCLPDTANAFLNDQGDPDVLEPLLIALLDRCVLLFEDQRIILEVDR